MERLQGDAGDDGADAENKRKRQVHGRPLVRAAARLVGVLVVLLGDNEETANAHSSPPSWL